MRTALVLVFVLLGSPSSYAQESITTEVEPAGDAVQQRPVMGLTAAGTRGANRVDAALPPRSGTLVLAVGGELSRTNSLFSLGDLNQRSAGRFTAAWAAFEGLEIWLGESMTTNYNSDATPATSATLGDPTLGLKYSHLIDRAFGVGAALSVRMPTSAAGTGLAPEGSVLTARAAVTMLPASWAALSLNAGYRLDNSAKVFEREKTPAQRFAAGINKADAMVTGVALQTRLDVGELMVLGPFAEITADLGVGVPAGNSPMRAALGMHVAPFGSDLLDFAVGGEWAFTGVPEPDQRMKMAGVPPWELFLRLATRISAPDAVTPAARSCAADADCSAGESCMDGICGRVREVVREVIKEVDRTVAAPTFQVDRNVLDDKSGDPIASASLRFSGIDGSALAVDDKTGGFRSWPLPSGEGMLRVIAEAAGYRPAEQVLPRGAAGEVKSIQFTLQPAGEEAKGELRGIIKDALTGKPVGDAQVFIPALNRRLKTDTDGKSEAQLVAGRYQLLISTRRHATQKMEIRIRAGDVVILNLDMSPRR